ncbi:fatty acyl-CoA synthetase [Aldersonia kunmingensis]|uniref:fatty acyl-CoA synthetase n=1 Tax=Aldersonia kunmingensis TaxID=408066 RepID=UPI00082B1209|nr:fatty acyl-CoA synthetase [Aldersonia kunmingensis]
MTEEQRARSHALGDIPRRTAARVPDRTALIHRDTVLTFAELDRAIDAFAAQLWASGLRPGDRLAILSHNCWQYPVAIFGAARIGVIGVPINFMLTAEEIAYILADCTPATLVVEDALCSTADQAIQSAGTTSTTNYVLPLSNSTPTGWTNFDEALTVSTGAAPEVKVDDDALIRIMYTSGTESRPKGAMHSSRTLMWQYTSCIVSGGMAEADVEVHALPLYHCAQLDNFLITDIYLGATSIILDRPDPAALLAAIERHGATNLFCPPTVWIALLRELEGDGRTFASLRKGYYGASALPVEVLRQLRQRFPALELWNFYGQTEMGSLATVLPPSEQDRRPGCAGRAALNVETSIVDDDNNPLPDGTVGEIVHRSPQVTLGYYNLPERTAEAFAGEWFHSGDLGYFDSDGFLWVVDRKKDMVKTGGENVATREVEEVLYELPEIREAAVYGVPDDRWIEAVAATVVVADGAALDSRAIDTHCRTRLASYKIPKSIAFASELPRNPSGKILKRVLRERHNERTH